MAGVEEVGGGPAPVSITAGAGGEGPAASRGSWEEAGAGGSSCSFGLFTSSLHPSVLSRDVAHQRPHSLDALEGPHP